MRSKPAPFGPAQPHPFQAVVEPPRLSGLGLFLRRLAYRRRDDAQARAGFDLRVLAQLRGRSAALRNTATLRVSLPLSATQASPTCRLISISEDPE